MPDHVQKFLRHENQPNPLHIRIETIYRPTNPPPTNGEGAPYTKKTGDE